MIIKDTDLKTVDEIKERIASIDRQLDKLDGVWNPINFDKHHGKYSKLVARKESLILRLHQKR